MSDAELLTRFHDAAVAAFHRKGVRPAVPVNVRVSHHIELLLAPLPPDDGRPLRSWKVAVDFVCHDVKFSGCPTGIFAWPERPDGQPLAAMARLLIADTLASRGDEVDYADVSEIRSLEVSETDEPPDDPPP